MVDLVDLLILVSVWIGAILLVSGWVGWNKIIGKPQFKFEFMLAKHSYSEHSGIPSIFWWCSWFVCASWLLFMLIQSAVQISRNIFFLILMVVNKKWQTYKFSETSLQSSNCIIYWKFCTVIVSNIFVSNNNNDIVKSIIYQLGVELHRFHLVSIQNTKRYQIMPNKIMLNIIKQNYQIPLFGQISAKQNQGHCYVSNCLNMYIISQYCLLDDNCLLPHWTNTKY